MKAARPLDGFSLKDLPSTVWLFVVGVLLFGFGYGLEWQGFEVEAGITGALAMFLIAVAILGQLLVVALGILD